MGSLRRLATLCIAAWLVTGAAAWAQDVPAIAAAADLKFALDEIAQSFRQETGKEVRLVFGSSGNFVTQIENGAPFQMFLSADEDYVLRLAEKGLARGKGTLYAIGRVVLFVPTGSPLKADASLGDLEAALGDGRLKRFAIANPAHAPYGRAAREALQKRGLWESIEPRLVLGENASQAMQFAASGSTQGGIVPLSLSKAPQFAKLGSFAALPAEWHQPLRQRTVLLRNAGAVAQAFYAYVQTPKAREIFVRYGFVLAGEE
jgi:molybdate transport system substrate-binding protein